MQRRTSRLVDQLDSFRSLPKEVLETTPIGAVMTILAVVICSILFTYETVAFFRVRPVTDVRLDTDEANSLRINFDIEMLDVSCEFVSVGVWDKFGTDRQNITKDITMVRVGHDGSVRGHHYTDDELVDLDLRSTMELSEEERAELGSDWTSTDDDFLHQDFGAAVSAHDITIVNFYADWCPYCQMFLETWNKFQEDVHSGTKKFYDADGELAVVRAMKINCVDFQEQCNNQGVRAYPTVRVYRHSTSAKNFEAYEGPRDEEHLVKFVENIVKPHHLHTGAQYHNIFEEACRLSGFVDVSRVPGTLHFEVGHAATDRSLNHAYTNVSHTVHHLSFGENKVNTRTLPVEYQAHVSPLDSKTFLTERFHQAPHHHIKVMSTRFKNLEDIRSYQMTVQSSIRTIDKSAVPQASFSYDLSPVEVVVSESNRKWYDFITSLFAIIGGTFTFMSIASGVLNTTHKTIKSTLGKLE